MTDALTRSPETLEGLVSTVIPVYNRAGMIGGAVCSVLGQTYRPIEIILVDDGSTDGTLEACRRLAAEHPDVVHVARRENGGPGLARETGRLLARGEFIQYLDSDDVLLPRKFEAQVAALRGHPECGIAYGRSRLVGPDGGILLETSKWTGRRFETLFPALLVDRWWHTHTPLYRRSLCDQIGPWPARQPEDWDYDARAGALRTRLAYCDEVLSCQQIHDEPGVTKWPFERYLPQQAWFLPRLHECALRAGVAPRSAEMRHFARWAYSMSRQMALRGQSGPAGELLDLARRTRSGFGTELLLYRWLTRILGPRLAARCGEWVYRGVPRLRRGAHTLPQSAGWYRPRGAARSEPATADRGAG